MVRNECLDDPLFLSENSNDLAISIITAALKGRNNVSHGDSQRIQNTWRLYLDMYEQVAQLIGYFIAAKDISNYKQLILAVIKSTRPELPLALPENSSTSATDVPVTPSEEQN